MRRRRLRAHGRAPAMRVRARHAPASSVRPRTRSGAAKRQSGKAVTQHAMR
ncbi:histone H1 protein [Burkholderia pseudomallei MSHR346]|nr:histone H1 protein [Burkholderia pseudomallei MSHR346]